jgi:transposase
MDARTKKRHTVRMRLLNAQIEEIEAEMQVITNGNEELANKMNYLESIPGVSFIAAVTVVAETLGFSTITSAKQLTSYTGYDVVFRQSGTFKGQTRISKKGNKHIRAVLHMPSMTAIRVNPTLKPFYDRLKPNKVKPLIALVAVQRKLLILMYSLWKNEVYYDPTFEIKKRQENKSLAAQDSNSKIAIAS